MSAAAAPYRLVLGWVEPQHVRARQQALLQGRAVPRATPTRRDTVEGWMWRYFEAGLRPGSLGQAGIATSSRTPLYFQHQGHSRTVVGIMRKPPAKSAAPGTPLEYTLLLMDPGYGTEETLQKLRPGEPYGRLIKRGAHTLQTRDQYQVLFVEDSLLEGRALEDAKRIEAVEVVDISLLV